MSEKDILLKEETVLGLNEDVRLRREKNGVIIYWAVEFTGVNDKIDRSTVRYITSASAMMLALFDGKRSLKEIFQAVKYIWNKPSLSFTDFSREVEKFILNIEPLKLGVPILVEANMDKKQKFVHYSPESFIIKGDEFLPSSALPTKFPIEIFLMPTMNCVTDCVYCYMERHITKYSHITFLRWKELLSEMEKYQVAMLDFGGGDAMCYEHSIDMLEMASTFSPPPVLYITTKTYVSQEIAYRLAKIPRLKVQISLDSTNTEIADIMVQRKGYGKRAIESIKNLVKSGITPAVKAVVTPLSIQAMPQTVLDLYHLGVYPIRTAIYCSPVWHHKDELFNKASEYEEFKKKVKEIEAKYGFKIQMQGADPEENPKPFESFEKRKNEWDNRGACTIGKHQLVILPDGSLLGCEQIPQISEYFLGSVAKDSIYDVWNSESFKQKAYKIPREKYRGTICYNCREFEECHSEAGKGYCMRDSYVLYGTLYAPEPRCPYHNKKIPRKQ